MGGSRDTRLYLGLDLGGTNVKAGVVTQDGEVLSSASVPTESHKGPNHGVHQLVTAGRKAIEAAKCTVADIKAVGLATPGTMDIPGGMLVDPSNLPDGQTFRFVIESVTNWDCRQRCRTMPTRLHTESTGQVLRRKRGVLFTLSERGSVAA